MKILAGLIQGSPEWAQLRARRRCASDAPAMAGTSRLCSRSDLVRMKATGDAKEFSDYVQKNVIDKGHEIEAFALAEMERELGQELYPVTATDDAEQHLASFDGLTMDGEIAVEVKSWNEELARAVSAGRVPPSHSPQLDHQHLVGDTLKRLIFVVTDGTRDKFLTIDYPRDPERLTGLVRAWEQFEIDVANYQHVEVIPKAVAEPTMALPALAIDVKGDVALVTNLSLFGERLHAFIADLDMKPADDQSFANAEAAVKVLATAQERLEAAEASALARFTSIDDMRQQVAMYAKLSRDTRLMLEKVIKARKEEIRGEILHEGQRAFAAHHEKLNARFGRKFMPTIPTDFPGAMRGKKTVASLRDAVATELARAKIEANAVADAIDANLKVLFTEAAGFQHLFADLDRLVLKAPEDFVVLVRARITEHKAAEERRLEAERERIRAEEAAKLKAEQEARERAAQPAPLGVKSDPPAPYQVKPGMPAARARPTDEEIIAVLASHYQVSPATVFAWISEMKVAA